MTTTPISAAEQAEIDRLIHGTTAVATVPESGTVVAMGTPYEGASRFEKQMMMWAPPLQSADLDLLPHKDILDGRTRDLTRNDGYVQAAEGLNRDSIVGDFFVLNSKPMLKLLDRDETWAEEFQQEVEEKFTVWAESPMKWVDDAGKNDFTSMIRLVVGLAATGNEVLATAEWDRGSGRDYRTCVRLVDTDRLLTPFQEVNNPYVRGGFRHDFRGRPLSAFIRTSHPSDYRWGIGADPFAYREVPMRKPWGRQMVAFIMEQRRVDQTRAVADLVAGLREIAITKKFRDVTLQNAVLGAMYAATIESELPSQVVFEQLGQSQGVSGGVVSYAEDFLEALATYGANSNALQLDGIKVPHLFPGTKFKLLPASKPGGVGQDFEKSLLRYLAATLGVSYEELTRDYSSTNYSSARAALGQTAKMMSARKRIFADAFANFVFRLWLEEAINADGLASFRKADAPMLYTEGVLNTRFDALANAEWIGAARGQIDELKETQAAVLRIKSGLSTHEAELARLGKDWRKVYPQLERERKEREARGIVLFEDNSVNAASGSPREDQTGGEPGDGGEADAED